MSFLVIFVAALVVYYVVKTLKRKRAGASLPTAIKATIHEDYRGQEPDLVASKADRDRQARVADLQVRPSPEAVALIPAALEANNGDRVAVIKDLRASYPGLSLRDAKRLVDAAA